MKRNLLYTQVIADAQKFLYAIGIVDIYARTIFEMACFAMNKNGECVTTMDALDSALRIKDARTRTKSLNLLRYTKLIKTVPDNKNGTMTFIVNARAASNTSYALRLADASFADPLYEPALDSEGFLRKDWQEQYRAYEKNRDKLNYKLMDKFFKTTE
ncbi:hypothetical protein IPC65_24285 [Pseudomonas aeruginosa]|uniref:hypothetical protein n=1 Tax=Pseudomonas aeruginosa TaxID=287 RepID=UPI001067A490|nr:hypothetical protein [Pseudomonas aeruginosa]TEP98140.1 hypothetical protein IPC64_09800 [Pseudomonas aeruginosa]TEQ00674.1 hypothetical protein IPC65_24285 [Pseudomonas aeruginosa]TEQ11048.1 hypothetical protein IPC66_19105 [Pseudomonas aeruginosa]